jgi:serine/threonine protein phosphatase PrpC
VGDSVAWAITGDGRIDLTCNQQRKPLLGSGAARPVAFSAAPLAGTLLLGSDGLAKYARSDDIAAIARGNDLTTVARELVNLVRLPSGSLQDDVAICLVRPVE